jgi:catechol 2,3-dioxygenase-like lactoylglutathione lyase family enzyme
MIGYVTIGTNDLTRAAAFYDALLGEAGAKRMMETEQFIAWSVRPDAPGLGVTKPFDKKPAPSETASWWLWRPAARRRSMSCIARLCSWAARTKARRDPEARVSMNFFHMG